MFFKIQFNGIINCTNILRDYLLTTSSMSHVYWITLYTLKCSKPGFPVGCCTLVLSRILSKKVLQPGDNIWFGWTRSWWKDLIYLLRIKRFSIVFFLRWLNFFLFTGRLIEVSVSRFYKLCGYRIFIYVHTLQKDALKLCENIFSLSKSMTSISEVKHFFYTEFSHFIRNGSLHTKNMSD